MNGLNTLFTPSDVISRLRGIDPKSDPNSKQKDSTMGRVVETFEKAKGICIELKYENFDAFADVHVVVSTRDDGYFCVLPDELLSLIFTFIDDEQTFARSMRVNKRLRNLAEVAWRDSGIRRGLLEDEKFWAQRRRNWKWIIRSKKHVFLENTLKNGIGCFSTGGERRYEGEWSNDKREGWGSNYLNGVVYKGAYFQDKKEGFGVMYFPKGARYEGEWKNDRKEGKGCYHFSNGDHYDGEWRNDVKSGYGTYVFGPGQWEGDKYEGEWRNDKKTGQGVYTWKDGGIYDGEFEEDFFSGFGTYYYPCGDKYVGQWKSDKRCGFGVYTYSHGGRFEGNFKDGKRNGTGVFYWRNGDKFKGNWIQNSRRGVGTLFLASGARIKQEWDEPFDANYSLREPAKHPEIVEDSV